MHFLNINDFNKEQINKFLEIILDIKNKIKYQNISIHNEYVANIFLEPSTRTLNSFIKAEYELNMLFVNIDSKTSSLKKNETLFDTVITLKHQGFKTFIIRGYDNYYLPLLKITDINLINAGDGSLNHPSQALLDLFTIYEYAKLEKKSLADLKMLVIGDLKNSRVYKSNKQLFEKMGITISTFAPKEFDDQNSHNFKINNIQEIKNFDIIMLLRIQYERHQEQFKLSHDEYNKQYGLNANNIKYLKSQAIFMHPGPINLGIEITEDVAYSKQSKILTQVENGVYTRIAILLYCLGKVKI